MAVERAGTSGNLVDVLDRVLDKGIVIDAWVRASLVGIDLLAIEAKAVVASIETYLKYAEDVAIRRLAAQNEQLRRRLDDLGPDGPAPVFARLKFPPGIYGGLASPPPPPEKDPDEGEAPRRRIA
jgi:hypothetical protein